MSSERVQGVGRDRGLETHFTEDILPKSELSPRKVKEAVIESSRKQFTAILMGSFVIHGTGGSGSSRLRAKARKTATSGAVLYD